MSLEGIVYPIVTLSLWVSLFIELKSFKIALMYATLNMGRKGTSKLSSLRTAMFLPFPDAGAAGSCWFAGGSGACAGAAGCWACCSPQPAGLLRALTSIELQYACFPYRNSIIQHAICKHTMSQSIIYLFTGYRFLAVPYRYPRNI